MAGKKLIVALFTLCTLAVASEAIAAPAIAWFFVQHRSVEDGTEIHRLGFAFKDAKTGAYLLKNKLESVTLFDPTGAEMTIPEPIFSGVYTAIDGEYDGKTGIWNYGQAYKTADYKADLEQELVVGTYHLVAVFDGTEVDATFNFTGTVDLPITPASSIKSGLDPSGNLICTWTVPYDLSRNNPSLATWARATIDIKKNGKIIGSLYYRVPTHLGRVFIPKTIVDTLKGLGGSSYAMTIMLRTNDNSVRALSNKRKLVLE